MISWNGAAEKYDIRDWAPEHEKMGKGITLSQEEAEARYELLGKTLKKIVVIKQAKDVWLGEQLNVFGFLRRNINLIQLRP